MASLLDSAAIISVGSTLPLWRSAFALDDWAVGGIGSVLALAIAVGSLLGGPASDRLGRVPVFAATVCLYAAGAVVLATAAGTATLLCGVLLVGLAAGADLPGSIAMVADVAPHGARGQVVALTHVLWTVGILCATTAALVASPAGLAGMRAVFWILAASAAATVVARVRISRHAGRKGPDADLADAHRPRTDAPSPVAAVVVLAVFYALYSCVANTFGSFRTYFLVVTGGATQTAATAVALVATVVGLVGTVTFSLVADSPARRRAYPLGAVLVISALALIAATGGSSLSLVLLALTVFSLGYPFVGEGPYKVWSQEIAAPGRRGTVNGVTSAIGRATAAGFALVTPTLLTWSPHGLFWILTAAAVVALAAGAMVPRLAGRASRLRPA
jgi:inositol transporter-like SP family MFS transporter